MKKVLVSIDNDLLAKIDREAHQRRMSRSAYFSRLAEADLLRGQKIASRTRSLTLLERLSDHALSSSAIDSTDAIRADRDARK